MGSGLRLGAAAGCTAALLRSLFEATGLGFAAGFSGLGRES